MLRFCARVAYDGSDFWGFQVQESGPTIQGALETALAEVTGQFSRISGAGRTDRGVHARGQVIAGEVRWRHPLDALRRAWNHYLPSSIVVRQIAEAPGGFHPRFSATARTYTYTVYAPERADGERLRRFPLLDRYALVLAQPLDLAAMNQAAALLRGEHDFGTFGWPTQGESTVRRVEQIGWRRRVDAHEYGGDPSLRGYVFDVTANGFLRRMVRNVVGSLLAVGLGTWQVDDVATALRAAERRRSAPPAPPQGLVLERVAYGQHPELFTGQPL